MSRIGSGICNRSPHHRQMILSRQPVTTCLHATCPQGFCKEFHFFFNKQQIFFTKSKKKSSRYLQLERPEKIFLCPTIYTTVENFFETGSAAAKFFPFALTTELSVCLFFLFEAYNPPPP